MPVGEEVEIPAGVLVRCPLVQFDLRPASRCEACTHFGGLTEMLGGTQAFHRRFAVNCRSGVDRDLFHLADD